MRTLTELPDTGAFTSDLLCCTLKAPGWLILPCKSIITRLPVWDAEHDLAARAGFGPASEWLADWGYRLPTVAEMNELHALSHCIDPYTMPTQEMLVEAGIPQTQSSIDSYRNSHMMSHRWCAIHDRACEDALKETGWDERQPVANFGKHWVSPVGTIYGWWKSDGSMWQNPSTFHKNEPTYVDYATNFHAVCEPKKR